MQEQQKEWRGITYALVPFSYIENTQQMKQTSDNFIAYGNAVQKRIKGRFKSFLGRAGKLEVIASSYGRNRLTLRASYDELINWKGGFFIVAETEDGVQALSLLEYVLNNSERPSFPVTVVGPTEVALLENIPVTYQPLSKISFGIEEAIASDGKRCVSFATQRGHPILMWREVYHGFIEELSDGKIESVEMAKKHGLFNRFNEFIQKHRPQS